MRRAKFESSHHRSHCAFTLSGCTALQFMTFVGDWCDAASVPPAAGPIDDFGCATLPSASLPCLPTPFLIGCLRPQLDAEHFTRDEDQPRHDELECGGGQVSPRESSLSVLLSSSPLSRAPSHRRIPSLSYAYIFGRLSEHGFKAVGADQLVARHASRALSISHHTLHLSLHVCFSAQLLFSTSSGGPVA